MILYYYFLEDTKITFQGSSACHFIGVKPKTLFLGLKKISTLFIIFIQAVVKILDQLGFEEEAFAISRISWSHFESVTLRDIYRLCNRPIFHGIARRQSFDIDVKDYLMSLERNKLKTMTSPIYLARNYFIFHQVCIDGSRAVVV